MTNLTSNHFKWVTHLNEISHSHEWSSHVSVSWIHRRGNKGKISYRLSSLKVSEKLMELQRTPIFTPWQTNTTSCSVGWELNVPWVWPMARQRKTEPQWSAQGDSASDKGESLGILSPTPGLPPLHTGVQSTSQHKEEPQQSCRLNNAEKKNEYLHGT